jgi:hypothetical protein
MVRSYGLVSTQLGILQESFGYYLLVFRLLLWEVAEAVEEVAVGALLIALLVCLGAGMCCALVAAAVGGEEV